LFALLQNRPGDCEGAGCGKRASPLYGGLGADMVAPLDEREMGRKGGCNRLKGGRHLSRCETFEFSIISVFYACSSRFF